MHPLRTRFKEDIVAEFMPPYLGDENKKADKVIIFCEGMPAVPSKRKFLEFWSKKGYWIFHPRYRGAWESNGEFLAQSPEKDILDVIDELTSKKKVTNVWDNTEYEIEPKEIYLFGSSFGGPAALLASRDPRVKKVVCISPVVDWTAPSEEEPIETFGVFVKKSFGEGYRFQQENWNKLKTGQFYNPALHADEIDGNKVMIFHAEDDKVVGVKEVKDFAQKINCKFFLLKKGGHLSSRVITKFWNYLKVKKFME